MKNANENFNAGLAYSDYKTRKLFYMLAAFVAFAMSSYFVVGYLAGHLRVLEWDGSQWMNGLVAIGITAVMTGYQFILYGAGNVAGGKKATILAVVVAVSFSMLSEVGQGMERDNIRMETKSQESPTYKAIVGAIGGSASASPYSADLQNAEMKLATCIQNRDAGKGGIWADCTKSAARVEAVNKMIANHATASQSQALALAATAKTMEKDESNYHPLVNLLRETFGASGTVGSFLVSLTLIAFFEYAFHYLGGQFAAAREYLMAHGYDVTRNLRQPPRKFDGSISTYSDKSESAPMAALNGAANSAKQTVGEYAAKIEEGLKASPEIIATEYARAQHAREQSAAMVGDKLQAVGNKIDESLAKKPEVAERHHLYCTLANGRKMDKVFKAHEADAALKEWQRLNKTGIGEDGNPITMLGLHQTYFETEKEAEAFEKKIEAENLKWQSDAPVIKSVTGFKQSADQAANVSRLYQAETAKHEAGEVFNQSPTPAIKRQSVAETIHALVDAVKKSGATTEADIQAAVFDGYSKLFNPADLDDGDLLKVVGKIAKATPATNERAHSANEQIIDARNERGANQHAHSPTFIPTNERAHSGNERTASNEPVHSTNERAHSYDAEKELLEAMKDAQGKIEADILKEGYGLYEQWKAAILSGETKLTTRDGRSFVNAHLCQGKKRTITPEGMNALIVIWQARAAKEGVLLLNPRYTGKPPFTKYLLA
ncbi:MAG: hypothetical protein L3K52_07955 [Candidatus Thiothrix sulfatifontis]|nr:MAG: hypothetical protein L3K52_07955 [Candidatus Thiothrix sulfatifontis]